MAFTAVSKSIGGLTTEPADVLEALSRALFEEEVEKFSAELLEARGWTLFERKFPVLEVGFSAAGGARLRVCLRCDEWNDRPPAVELRDWEGAPLRSIERDPAGVFNNGPHPATGKPFVCMKGAREYHTHPSHLNDAWGSAKTGSRYTLGGILTQIWHAWRSLHK
jgi:hypothetical protein